MKNIYGYRLPHGTLILYGHNIKACEPYIDNTINSVEEACKYCSQHNLRILHKANCRYSFSGLFEFIIVYRLANKYSVYGSWEELPKYFGNSK